VLTVSVAPERTQWHIHTR